MGLDMFLHKVKREEIAYWRKANAIHEWFNNLYAKYNDGEELGNCQSVPVSKDDLIELRDTCKKVLGSSKLVYKEVSVKRYNFDTESFDTVSRTMKVLDNPSVAQELLPTQDGYFYGSTEYDEGYVEDLEQTVKMIDEILATVDFNEYDIEYHAWW